MALDDYEADATELLETYGTLPVSVNFCSTNISPDFLMKYIVIGLSFSELRGISCSFPIPGEAGAGKSCLLHQFTHNSCLFPVRGRVSIEIDRHFSQRAFTTYYRRRVLQ